MSISNATPLIVGISGIRGIIGENFTPQIATDFAAAYGTPLIGQKVVVSRDGRSTGPMIKHAVIAGLLSVGCRVEDIGIAATPTCGFFVKKSGAAGAIQITASHNPPPWNGLKLFRAEGFVVSPEAGAQIAKNYNERRFSFVDWKRVPSVEVIDDPHRPHLEAVLASVDVNAIRRRKFRVVLDANHGSGSAFGPRLLEALGCDIRVLGGEADGRFEHEPEPIEENLKGLAHAVREYSADVGFATDPDADRLAIVDETSRYIGEEYTLALAIKHRLTQEMGPVVINGSTSRISEDAARHAGARVIRTKVGEVHVAERMIAENAVIGGEGNGGVIDPRIGYIRDSAIGMAVTLEMLALRERPLSVLVDEIPRYVIRKEKFPVDRPRLGETLDRVAEHFKEGSVNREDGVRVDFEDGWVQLRGSNTEPIVRVISEARTPERADSLCHAVRRIAVG
ncbi:phosphoglucosamine mutase [bacterium]|nr:phosphoglucosamine mutase [bacterium]